MPPRSKVCLVPNCGRIPRARGLCISCFAVARDRVVEGVISWETLERAKLAYPPRVVRKSPMAEAIAAIKAKRKRKKS